MFETAINNLRDLTWPQWIGLVVLALVAARQRDLVKPLLARVKPMLAYILTPKRYEPGEPDVVTTTYPEQPPAEPTEVQAFQAVHLLIDHFSATGCEGGLAAAREAGRHLFDAPDATGAQEPK